MRTETTTRTLYKFNELSEEGKQKALENMYNINVDHEWYEFIFEDAKTIGALIGIDIEKIYFSGFSSQGDGACFEGYYRYEKGSAKNLKEHAPKDKELHRIVEELQELQRKNFYGLTANVKHSGHYSHENCTIINVDSETEQEIPEDEIEDLLRDYMRWIYRVLEKEYEYLTGDEAIKETIECNEYEFTEDGEQA